MRFVTMRVLVRTLILAALAFAALPAASASAGRFVGTGHDVDDHCGANDDAENEEQCSFMEVATDYVRDGSSKRVLLLDCSGSVRNALDKAFGDGVVPRERICPSDDPSAFNDEELSTDRYSAIIVGSSCDEGQNPENSLNLTEDDPNSPCDEEGGRTPDSDLINARDDDIKDFFNDGGGIFAMSGGDNGDGDPSTGPDVYYDFVPIGVQGTEVNPPFCLTQEGIDIGFEDTECPDPSRRNGNSNSINCCETHNSFAEPDPDSALKVAERDSGSPQQASGVGTTGNGTGDGFPETLVAEGVIDGGFEPPPPDDEDRRCGGEEATFVGTNGDDVIDLGRGRDVIVGREGDDRIEGGRGDDIICGNEGQDSIKGNDGNDVAKGNENADKVKGNKSGDRVRGNSGADLTTGGDGDDSVRGGPGADEVQGESGDDRLRGNPGDDLLNGGPDFDLCEGDGGNDSARNCEAAGFFP